ncbi:hypothetical protein CRE_14289 [Caenorhabditis remanei]|uniref:Secreted protein n=1 Tax=Caenorhabditis remanei TaxID=31234 RepID=E3NBU1_CAERE|nr:hypothetical protein CRE_14289 [Caenorhabditis remanei]
MPILLSALSSCWLSSAQSLWLMSSVLTSEDSVISPPTAEESVVERVLYLDTAAIGVVHVGALYEYEMRPETEKLLF